MFTSDIYHSTKVITHRGVVEISDVLPGDYVYEYRTSKPLQVLDIVTPEYRHNEIYRITFTDGRRMFVQEGDNVFSGKYIIPVEKLPKEREFIDIRQYYLDYHSPTYKSLDPDPYLAGAFIMNASYDDPYINLPYYMDKINDSFEYKYSVDYLNDSIIDNRVHFKYKGTSEPITWNQFFNGNRNYITAKDMRMNIIPDIYVRSNYKDRVQFVRGAFDAAYNPSLFGDDFVGIVNQNDHRLCEFQKILWSLGIFSKVEFDPYIDRLNGNKYKLTIIDNKHGYPGFTYILDNIEYLLDQDNKIIDYDHQFAVKVDHVCRMTYRGYKRNLVLEKPNSVFLSGNYLPLVSL